MLKSNSKNVGHSSALLVTQDLLHILKANVGLFLGEGGRHMLVKAWNTIFDPLLLGEPLYHFNHAPVVEDELNITFENAGKHIPVLVLISKAKTLIFLFNKNPLYLFALLGNSLFSLRGRGSCANWAFFRQIVLSLLDFFLSLSQRRHILNKYCCWLHLLLGVAVERKHRVS